MGKAKKRARTGSSLSKPPKKFRKGLDRYGVGYNRYTRMKSTFKPEMKFEDTTDTVATVAATGDVLNSVLFNITQGSGESDRIGRKITVKSMYVRGNILLPAATDINNTQDELRVIIYQDKQSNGAAAAVTDIVQNADLRSFLNLANKNRFRILADKNYVILAPGVGGNGTTHSVGAAGKHYKISLPKLNIPVEYTASTGAITDLASNNIGVLTFSKNGLITNTWRCRVRFYD